MIEKTTTRVILKEVIGTLAAVGAAGLVAGAVRGAIKSKNLKQYVTPGTRPGKPAGMSARIFQNVRNALSAYGERAQEGWLEKKAEMDTQIHSQIAAQYNLKPTEYARVTAEHARKNKALSVINDPKTRQMLLSKGVINISRGGQLSGLENIDIEDLPNIEQAVKQGNPAAYTARTPKQTSRSIQDVIDKPTTLEVLDQTNPTARQFREKMTKEFITPKSQAATEKAVRDIETSKKARAAMQSAISQDKQNQMNRLNSRILALRPRPGSNLTTSQKTKRRVASALLGAKQVISSLDFWN